VLITVLVTVEHKKIFENQRSFLLAVLAAYVGIASLAMLVWPSALERLFLSDQPVYDAVHYRNIIVEGYSATDTARFAFYPLWPLLVRALAVIVPFVPIALLMYGLGLGFFAAGIWLLYVALGKLGVEEKNRRLCTLLAALNPCAIFPAIGYAEGLYFLLCTGVAFFVGAGGNHFRALLFGALLSVLASLTKPSLPTLVGAAFVTVCLVPAVWRRGLAVAIGTVAGLCLYGLYCLQVAGSFWWPLTAQEHWHRRLGFYPEVLLSPKAIGNSPEVLLWDLLALAVATVLVVWVACRSFQRRLLPSPAPFAAAAAFSYPIINLLTYPQFYSVERHVFGTPFWAMALALLYPVTSQGQGRGRRIIELLALLLCAFYFFKWWARFARAAWLG
jgi:hypothetical protein